MRADRSPTRRHGCASPRRGPRPPSRTCANGPKHDRENSATHDHELRAQARSGISGIAAAPRRLARASVDPHRAGHLRADRGAVTGRHSLALRPRADAHPGAILLGSAIRERVGIGWRLGVGRSVGVAGRIGFGICGCIGFAVFRGIGFSLGGRPVLRESGLVRNPYSALYSVVCPHGFSGCWAGTRCEPRRSRVDRTEESDGRISDPAIGPRRR
jgi:hypothetical protein